MKYAHGFLIISTVLEQSCDCPSTSKLTLTHWGRVTHICVSKLTTIGSDNGLSPDRHQAIIWTNAGILSIRPLGPKLSEILIEILTFSLKRLRLKVSSAKRRSFCLGLKVLKDTGKKTTLTNHSKIQQWCILCILNCTDVLHIILFNII